MAKKQVFRIALLLLFAFNSSCVEPVDVSPEITGLKGLEGLLVVEANITNLEKTQEVLLSRLQEIVSDSTVNLPNYGLSKNQSPKLTRKSAGPNSETGALVTVLDDQGTNYIFNEIAPGVYHSQMPFAAQSGVAYQLSITTSDGSRYLSAAQQLAGQAQIDSVYAKRMVNGNGVEGVFIFTDASFSEGSSKYLRYGFEEAYKIIAPNWTPLEFEIIRESQEFDQSGNILYPDVTTRLRIEEEQVCYNTERSTEEILVNGTRVQGTTIQGNSIRFLDRDNPIISHRYSILVKQFSVSEASFAFYETLKAFSQNASVFSQIQPGRLESNVFDENNEKEVFGYFDVSSEVSQRFYFNYSDLFPNEPLPPYFGNFNCNRILSPQLGNPLRDGPSALDCPQGLIPQLQAEALEYLDTNPNPGLCEGPYLTTLRVCGDCTVLGSNQVPDFWVED
ncbi:MAG: DUF4249 domain-containing protein [Bacteroidota bacterium]